ncbi:MAG: exopolysaccharide biosynthesis protein [Proteobacteria bacterium]|nr:exopolysaccharide biosynthesis protein [Pseudomonadota bacterium]
MSGSDALPGDDRPSPADASALVESMLRQVPADGVTAAWIEEHFLIRSPEMLFLIFTPFAVIPATSPVAGILLLCTATPLIFRRRAIFVPLLAGKGRLSAARFEKASRLLLRLLKRYEAYAMRRPHPPSHRHTRWTGLLIAVLGAALLVPLPFSNVLPGFTVGTVALASLEQDNRLLILASLLTGVSLLAVALEALPVYHLAALLL